MRGEVGFEGPIKRVAEIDSLTQVACMLSPPYIY